MAKKISDEFDKNEKGAGRKAAAPVAVGIIAATCALSAVAFGSQIGSGSFDPSDFLESGKNSRLEANYDSAFNVDTQSDIGKANMQSNSQQDEQRESALKKVDTTSGGETGNNALIATNGEGAGSVVTPGGSGGTSGAGDSVNGPVVDSNGGGSNPDGDNGGGTTPGDTGDNGSDNGGNGGETINDPDPTTPRLPESPGVPNQNFGDGVNTGSTEPAVTLSFTTDPDVMATVQLTPLYNNEVLTKQKLMCAAYYSATIDGTRYRLEELNSNFQIVGYSYDGDAQKAGLPSIIDKNAQTITVELRVRANSKCKWHSSKITLDLYPYKVLLTDTEGAVIDISNEWTLQYPNYYNEGDVIDLGKHFPLLQPAAESDGYIHQLFQGWSETPGGASLGASYQPTEKGLPILSPCSLFEVPDNLKVKLLEVPSFDIFGETTKEITLVDGPDSGDLTIPEGIAGVSEDYRPSEIGTLTIPATCTSLGNLAASVSDNFKVAEGNAYYSVANGLLINDTFATVPHNATKVVIPEGISVLRFPDENKIEEFVAEGENPSIQVENGLLIEEQEDMFGDLCKIAVVGGGMEHIKVPADAVDIQVPANNKLAWIDVEEGNAGGYSSINGMMGVQTVAEWPWESDSLSITLIPSKMETVTIPSGLNDITIPEDNSITRYENGDGEDFVRGNYWAAGGALCTSTEMWFDTVNEIVDVPSALETLTIPADISSIAEGAIHEDNNLSEYIVEEGNETYSSENGLLIETVYDFDMWGDPVETHTATVPPKMEVVKIPSGVDKLIVPENNSVKEYVADEGSTIMVENGMIIEDIEGWDEWEMCPTTVRTITKIPAGMKVVNIPDDVVAIADDAIAADNSIEWFEADPDSNYSITTSNGMLTSVTWEEDWFGDLNETVTITKVPDHMKTVTIEEKVSSIADGVFSGTNSVEEFIVEGEWSNFSVNDGLLYEFVDFDHYNIIGIPCNKEEVTIPAYIDGGWDVYGITDVTIPKSNSIKTLHYEGVHTIDWGMETDILITPDFSNLKPGTQIIVPDADFTDCYVAWGKMIEAGGLSLVSDAGQSSEDFIVRDGATLSKDGTVLVKVMDTNAGVYVVPDGVTTIASGATAECSEVNAILLPDSVTTVKTNAFTNENLKRVLFTAEKAPDVEESAVGSGISLQVASSSAATYEAAFGDASSQIVENNFTYGSEGGFTVLRDHLVSGSDNHVVVMDSPSSIERFDASSVAGATDINTAAFMNRTNLSIIDLPASVKTIGVNAFKGCKYVTLFNSASTDTISAAAGSFEGCGAGDDGVASINGMSFNAMNATLDASVNAIGYNLSNTHGYALCPEGSSGYEGGPYKAFGHDYELTQVGTAELLCGTTAQGHAIFGCSKNASGTLAIDPETSAIYAKAFYNTGVQQLNISNASPVSLVKYGGVSFQFKEDNGSGINKTPGIKVQLTGEAAGKEDAYIEAWKYPISNKDILAGADDVSAQNTVRLILGMEVLPPYALSADGTTLEKFIGSAMADYYQPITIPSSVTSIAAGASSSCGAITIYFEGATPPSIMSNSFNRYMTVILQNDAADHAADYVAAWKAPLYEMLHNVYGYTGLTDEQIALKWLGLDSLGGASIEEDEALSGQNDEQEASKPDQSSSAVSESDDSSDSAATDEEATEQKPNDAEAPSDEKKPEASDEPVDESTSESAGEPAVASEQSVGEE